MKKCKYCAEAIQDEAIICPHCKKRLVERKGKGKIVWGLVGIFVISPICFCIIGPFGLFLEAAFGWVLWAGIFDFFELGDFFKIKISKPIKILGLTVFGIVLLFVLLAIFSK